LPLRQPHIVLDQPIERAVFGAFATVVKVERLAEKGRHLAKGRAVTIRSLATVHHRLLLAVLTSRGFGLHRVAEAAAISTQELTRLVEFES
jgi:hypothetical protein